MTAQRPLLEQLRASIQLVKPELLADVPSDYNARQTFNFLRHSATNYDHVIEAHVKKYGSLTPDEKKAFIKGSADCLIEALRIENDELIQGKANTPFAKFVNKLRKLLNLDENIELEAIYKETLSLKKSQGMFKSWNERYRRQKALVMSFVAKEAPNIFPQVQTIYKANSDTELKHLEEKSDGQS